jgi:hypothetical protein
VVDVDAIVVADLAEEEEEEEVPFVAVVPSHTSSASSP